MLPLFFLFFVVFFFGFWIVWLMYLLIFIWFFYVLINLFCVIFVWKAVCYFVIYLFFEKWLIADGHWQRWRGWHWLVDESPVVDDDDWCLNVCCFVCSCNFNSNHMISHWHTVCQSTVNQQWAWAKLYYKGRYLCVQAQFYWTKVQILYDTHNKKLHPLLT